MTATAPGATVRMPEADYPEPPASHDTIPRLMRIVFRMGWSKTAERVTKALADFAGVPPLAEPR